MKLTTIALASAVALSTTFAPAYRHVPARRYARAREGARGDAHSVVGPQALNETARRYTPAGFFLDWVTRPVVSPCADFIRSSACTTSFLSSTR
jgi:hypothetical protein